jgi:sugar phosphate isomerase/epimerase
MRLAGDPDLGHLTYCTNIHAAEDWPEVLSGLRRHLPEIKAGFSPDRPMGVGLRLAASAVDSLQDPKAFAELRQLLDEGGYYVFTLNGFPYGVFHGKRVKEEAYRPDWSEEARLIYSNRLATLLAELLPEGMEGSVSTVPGTFKPWAEGAVPAIADNLIRHVAHLVELRQRTGKTIALALEPEPCCLLETIAEAIAFFESHLFDERAAARLAGLIGSSNDQAAAALRTHIGVCYDVCHAAVEFEDPRRSIDALRAAGIKIAKLQLSSAIRIASVDGGTADQLRSFNEPVYLHQVVEDREGELTRYLDLPEALEAVDRAAGAEWRIHFHVPIFLDTLKDFSTTHEFLSEVLALHRESPISPHLEVETYTWDVLPEAYRNVGLSAAIARELNWVNDQITT